MAPTPHIYQASFGEDIFGYLFVCLPTCSQKPPPLGSTFLGKHPGHSSSASLAWWSCFRFGPWHLPEWILLLLASVLDKYSWPCRLGPVKDTRVSTKSKSRGEKQLSCIFCYWVNYYWVNYRNYLCIIRGVSLILSYKKISRETSWLRA